MAHTLQDKMAEKLEEGLNNSLSAKLSEKDDLTPEEIAALTPDSFVVVPYNAEEAERTGYSNYSYWGSTVRMFFKNKVAVAMLIIMCALLLWTGLACAQTAEEITAECAMRAPGASALGCLSDRNYRTRWASSSGSRARLRSMTSALRAPCRTSSASLTRRVCASARRDTAFTSHPMRGKRRRISSTMLCSCITQQKITCVYAVQRRKLPSRWQMLSITIAFVSSVT